MKTDSPVRVGTLEVVTLHKQLEKVDKDKLKSLKKQSLTQKRENRRSKR